MKMSSLFLGNNPGGGRRGELAESRTAASDREFLGLPWLNLHGMTSVAG
jgi:hypothetical protein